MSISEERQATRVTFNRGVVQVTLTVLQDLRDKDGKPRVGRSNTAMAVTEYVVPLEGLLPDEVGAVIGLRASFAMGQVREMLDAAVAREEGEADGAEAGGDAGPEAATERLEDTDFQA